MLSEATQYIRSVKLNTNLIKSFDISPFNLPSIKNLSELRFRPRVTFIIVGENCTGKST